MSLSLLNAPLEGRFVRLEPFAPALYDAVAAAYAKDGDAWALTVHDCSPAGFPAWWEARCEAMRAGREYPFAVRRLKDGEIVGSSSFSRVRAEHRGCEIGSTYYEPAARSGPVNPETNRLLLDHAFGRGAIRVEFRTDAINLRSRAALTKLGAREEGVLRRHMVTWTGRIRDTVVFAITDVEWPAVRDRLSVTLAGFG